MGKMKVLNYASLAVMVIAVVVMGVNLWIFPLGAWCVRIAGIFLLVSLAVEVYSTVKIQGEKEKNEKG